MGCSVARTVDEASQIRKISDLETMKFNRIITDISKLKAKLDHQYNEAIEDCKSYTEVNKISSIMLKEIQEMKMNMTEDDVKNILFYEIAMRELKKYCLSEYELDCNIFNQLFQNTSSEFLKSVHDLLKINIGSLIDATVFTHEEIDKLAVGLLPIIKMMLRIIRLDKNFQRENVVFFINQDILENKELINEVAGIILNNTYLKNLGIAIMNESEVEPNYNNLSCVFEAIKLKKNITNLGLMIVNDDIHNITKENLNRIIEIIGLLNLESLGICNFPFSEEQIDLISTKLSLKPNLSFLAFQLPGCREVPLLNFMTKLSKTKSIKMAVLGYPISKVTDSLISKVNKIAVDNGSIKLVALDYISTERL